MELIKQSSTRFRNRKDAIAFFVHCCLISNQCQLVCFSENLSVNRNQSLSFDAVGWNENDDVYTFVYQHSRVNCLLLVKIVVMGQMMVVSAMKMDGSNSVLICQFNFEDFIEDFSIQPSLASTIYAQASKLEAIILSQIVAPLGLIESTSRVNVNQPQRASDEYAIGVVDMNQNAESSLRRTQNTSPHSEQAIIEPFQPLREQQQVEIERQNPRIVRPVGDSRQPVNPIDPLRIGPTRQPQTDFDADLYPGSFPHGGGGLMGPDHPLFQGGRGVGPTLGMPRGPRRGGRGVRFDPFGPFGDGNPDNDEFPPPGPSSWF